MGGMNPMGMNPMMMMGGMNPMAADGMNMFGQVGVRCELLPLRVQPYPRLTRCLRIQGMPGMGMGMGMPNMMPGMMPGAPQAMNMGPGPASAGPMGGDNMNDGKFYKTKLCHK